VGDEDQMLGALNECVALKGSCGVVEGMKLPIQVKRHNPKDRLPQP